VLQNNQRTIQKEDEYMANSRSVISVMLALTVVGLLVVGMSQGVISSFIDEPCPQTFTTYTSPGYYHSGVCDSLYWTSPGIRASDQSISGGSVVVSEVVSDGPGWVVVRDGNDTSAVAGYTMVDSGASRNVKVTVDPNSTSTSLFAELHKDAGKEGVFEYPGPDSLVEANGAPVRDEFSVVRT
jgi:hypothetical protein